MPLLDVEKLLQPISDAEPAGPNLEYDAAFTTLEKVAAGKPEQQMGGTIVPAEPPDWNAVFEQALALLGRTKDLRIAAKLAEAAASRNGMAGFSEAIAVVRGLIERHWAVVHPQLDPDDDNDPTMRFTALASLGTQAVMSALRVGPLLASRTLGPVTLADFGIDPTGKADPAAADAAKIQAAFAENDLAALEQVFGSVVGAQESLGAIDASLQTFAGSQGPDLAPLVRIVYQARQALEPRIVQRRADEAGPEAAAAGVQAGAGAAGGQEARAMRGDILSREDVNRALDKICQYYEKNEPSSPVPLLLQRAKRLVSLSFVEILKDLAPDGMKQIDMVAGKRKEEE
jgi:type VI secretion system protein ImpA